ncbi:MAG: aminopeptidase [Bacteroidia bacterium]|nr:aminopeptidase [Bacteroidia bacterium]
MKNLVLLFLMLGSLPLIAQEEIIRNKPGGHYEFTIETSLDATPVKDQASSGTCWSFSTVSFFESELLRMGKGQYDLSEMYVVRQIWPMKADQYVRMHGSARLSGGGLFHDVNTIFSQSGMMPESAYSGKLVNPGQHNHNKMEAIIESFVEAVVKNRKKQLTSQWDDALEGILDAYLGEVPETFEYRGETYTPQSFAESLELDMNDYVELMSFQFQPYYQQSVLMVPDNWDYHAMWNLPLDELVATVDHALEQGYTVAWDADVSEKTFSHRNGVAVIPWIDWNEMNATQQAEVFDHPQKEMDITEELRQAAFDDQRTTDDHLMHITGIAKDQNGHKYYLVKNSWGDSNACGGYVFVSEAYFRYKTIHVMLHKDGVPASVAGKLW